MRAPRRGARGAEVAALPRAEGPPIACTVVPEPDPLLLTVAAAFAVLNGVNDGGTLLTLSLKVGGVRLLTALGVLAAFVALAPALLGTAVASTLAGRLVAFDGPQGQRAVLLAVVAAVLVSSVLARRGLPTSLTLALVGGLTGAGLGAGLAVSWPVVGGVLATAAVAPMLGGALAFGLSRLALRVRAPAGSARFLARAHRLSLLVQALAYGANDGQKMLAVAAVGAGLATDPVPRDPVLLVAAVLLFALGAALGLRRYSRTVGGVIPVRPPNAVIGQVAASVAVLASAGLGAPVSMTQAVSGGLVGTGVSEGHRRVRWQVALQIGTAWVVTLPLALLVGLLVAAGAAAIAGAA